MKRFIRYLYEYENGKRTRNVGFVKVETGSDETMIHIHGKGLRMDRDSKLVLYLFYEEDGKCIGVWQAETDNINPTVNYHLRYTDEDTGVPGNYQRIQGILMESSNGRKFAAMWEDVPIDVNRMQTWQPPLEENTNEEILEEPILEEPILEEPILEEIVAEESASEPEQPQKVKVMKIQRNDLAKLPRCEWNLANNNFLMHGYYNYRHLALIDEDDEWKIGVPGIYHVREERAAKNFGFDEFLPIERVEVSLNSEESSPEEQFGYWCRQVKKCRALE